MEVKFFNQMGKLVYVYGKQHLIAGYNEVLWEGINNAGWRINNVVYIYHLKAKSTLTGKVTTTLHNCGDKIVISIKCIG